MSNLKKQLTLLAGSVLLLTGCAKDDLASRSDGEMTQVTFTTQLEGQVTTRAAADGDGVAASVNRCIMEVYYGDELFTRQYAAVSDKKASFTITAVANRTYNVAFWADHVADATSSDGLAVDSFYVTTNGLDEVTLKGTYLGNDDKRDAFAFSSNYTIAQGGSAFNVTLKRPFAQINVITTDVETVKKVSTLAPDSVNLTIKNAVSKYNVLDSTAVSGNTSDLTYTAKVYKWDSSKSECTLSMDYLFAENTKSVIDIDWNAKKTGNTDVSHSFANIPYQRNYRTNIKGALLTTQGQWNVTVDPAWSTPDEEVVFKVVNNIAAANEVVASNKDKKEINVTFSSEPDDAGNPATSGNNAIVTSLLSEGAVYNIDVASTTDTLYVGDYDYNTTSGETTYDYTSILPSSSNKTDSATVNIVVSDNLYIGTLVINSPSKSVTINGQTVNSGKMYHIENLTVEEVSMHTVIIEKGMTVEKLKMVKGGLEIHGTVNSVEIASGATTSDIKVRDCEGLSETVYNVLKDYIDTENGYTGVQDDGEWNIVLKSEWQYHTAKEFSNINGTTITIMNAAELALFAKNYATYGTYTIKLGCDINLIEYDWNPIASFAGTFDGQNHTINSMRITGDTDKGLFDNLNNATVKDLTINAASVNVKSNDCGILSGSASSGSFNNVKILSSSLTTTGERVGALCGSGYPAVDGCEISSCTITGSEQVGAAIGYMWIGSIQNSKASANVVTATNTRAGGLVGKMHIGAGNLGNSSMWLKNNVVSGSVSSATDGNAGGLIGQFHGDDARYEISGNSIDVEGADCPIGPLRAFSDGAMSTAFTTVLDTKVFDNSWTKATLDADRYVYTDAVTSSGEKIIWNAAYPDVAVIGNVKYKDLAYAISVASSEATIKMIKNFEVTEFTGDLYTISAGKNITLDLNGYTVSATASDSGNHNMFLVKNGATFTVKDGAENGGNISYTYKGSHGYSQENTVYVNGDFNLISGTINNLTTNDAVAHMVVDFHPNEWGDTYSDLTPTFHMTGGKLYTVGEEALRLSNYGTENASLYPSAIIDGGELEGWDAIFIQEPNGNYVRLDLTINGGTLKGSKAAIRVYSDNPTKVIGDDNTPINIALNGGTFTSGKQSVDGGSWLLENIVYVQNENTVNYVELTGNLVPGKQ